MITITPFQPSINSYYITYTVDEASLKKRNYNHIFFLFCARPTAFPFPIIFFTKLDLSHFYPQSVKYRGQHRNHRKGEQEDDVFWYRKKRAWCQSGLCGNLALKTDTPHLPPNTIRPRIKRSSESTLCQYTDLDHSRTFWETIVTIQLFVAVGAGSCPSEYKHGAGTVWLAIHHDGADPTLGGHCLNVWAQWSPYDSGGNGIFRAVLRNETSLNW